MENRALFALLLFNIAMEKLPIYNDKHDDLPIKNHEFSTKCYFSSRKSAARTRYGIHTMGPQFDDLGWECVSGRNCSIEPWWAVFAEILAG